MDIAKAIIISAKSIYQLASDVHDTGAFIKIIADSARMLSTQIESIKEKRDDFVISDLDSEGWRVHGELFLPTLQAVEAALKRYTKKCESRMALAHKIIFVVEGKPAL